MPCRALEAFRRQNLVVRRSGAVFFVLMPCRALEAFRPAANPPEQAAGGWES